MYATIAERHGRDEEALGVLLRLVVKNQDHRRTRQLVSKVPSWA